MNLLETLKLDIWWKAILLLGIGSIFSSLFFKIEFLQNKHLFGLGLGLISIGFSFWIAERKKTAIKPPNVYTGATAVVSWIETRHNFISIIFLLFGIICIGLFGYLILGKLV